MSVDRRGFARLQDRRRARSDRGGAADGDTGVGVVRAEVVEGGWQGG